jgi:DNA-binding HxlR family transcriptional regulator
MLGRYYRGQDCAAARALELVGERWSLLILRDAMFRQYRRFSDFEKSLGIAPNVLAKRLESFVADGLMELHVSAGEPREYLLTAKGRALKPVIIALTVWGDSWLEPGPIDYVHPGCDGIVEQSLRCGGCGDEVAVDEIGVRLRSTLPD